MGSAPASLIGSGPKHSCHCMSDFGSGCCLQATRSCSMAPHNNACLRLCPMPNCEVPTKFNADLYKRLGCRAYINTTRDSGKELCITGPAVQISSAYNAVLDHVQKKYDMTGYSHVGARMERMPCPGLKLVAESYKRLYVQHLSDLIIEIKNTSKIDDNQ